MSTQEIRQKYLDFFEGKGHKVIPRANLVPQEDPTTLFTGSGMQPLLPYLLGAKHPAGTRLVNSQTCFRAEDIDEAGDNRHTTFFEMLGNWSLGDYFKEEQLPWFFEFLTDEVGLDPKKLYVTCFIGSDEFGVPKDTESAQIWQRLFEDKNVEAKTADIGSEADGYARGMKKGERVFYYAASKNWWSRTGEPQNMPEGEPGGPDSEVFFDVGTEHDESYGKHCHPNCDCGRWIEIGNSVFMQFVKNESGGFDELPQKNVDFGGGLERIAQAVIGSPDMFKISFFEPIIKRLEKASHKTYKEYQESMRVIADHMRAATWLGLDGVVPSNNEQGYVMRRLIRRAVRFAFNLEIQGGLAQLTVPAVIKEYQKDFPEVAERGGEVVSVIEKEEKVFRQTLRKGVSELVKIFNRLSLENKNVEIGGELVFKMYDTYGFPPELTVEEIDNLNKLPNQDKISLSKEWQNEFEAAMQEQKERSRTATKGQFKGGLGGEGEMHKKYHTATHLMYRALRLVLGDHVVQRGSNVTDERLRFDFSHPEKMTDEQKSEVERIVNEQIKKDLKVSWQEMPTQEALAQGAMGAFGDKYGETVKVYQMGKEGEEPFSFEICGGPHVEHTGELAAESRKFKIKKEESSSAGVRRIKAVLE